MATENTRPATAVTIQDWLRVRAEVADIVREGAPRTQSHVAIAEALMTAGVIDVPAVLDRVEVRAKPAKRIDPATITNGSTK